MTLHLKSCDKGFTFLLDLLEQLMGLFVCLNDFDCGRFYVLLIMRICIFGQIGTSENAV